MTHLENVFVMNNEYRSIPELLTIIENIENANEMWKERAKGFTDLVNEKADVMIENQELKEKLRQYEVLDYSPKELEIELNKGIINKLIVQKATEKIKDLERFDLKATNKDNYVLAEIYKELKKIVGEI